LAEHSSCRRGTLMPGPGTLALAAGGAVVAYGAYRIAGFLRKIAAYRAAAKGGALAAPAGFAIGGSTAARAKALEWFVIDDQVMGGKSQSHLNMNSGSIEFEGVINTNGGGFSSCRTLGDDEPLGFPADTCYVEVTAICDARQYHLNLMTADSWAMSVPTWRHDFRSSQPGKAETFKLPLKDFKASMRGNPVPGAVLDPAAITGVGVSLSLYTMHGEPNPHFGDGPFKVTIVGVAVGR